MRSGAVLLVGQVERACLCAVCPRVTRDGRVCTVSGEAVSRHVTGEISTSLVRLTRGGVAVSYASTCPAGRHLDDRGRVVWMGVSHLRVPKLVRVWLAVRRGMKTSELPRCGCVAALKVRWRWLRWKVMSLF